MLESISRRSFVAGAAALGAAFAAGGLSGCGGTPSSVTGSDTPGSIDPAVPAADISWLGEAPKIDASQIADTKEADIVVVGAGTGGLFTACAAAEAGASVIMLEKAAKCGIVRDDVGGANSRRQKDAGTVIDREAMSQDMYRYSNGHQNKALFYKWYDKSAETIDWYDDLLAKNGIVLWNEAAVGDKEGLLPHWATGHSPAWPADGSLDGATVLSKYALGKGVDIEFSTPMVELVTENGAVTGVIAQNADGDYIQVKAKKGVVVSTGGYAANAQMLAALQPDIPTVISTNWSPTENTGDGIRACLWAGASMDATHSSMLFDRAVVPPDAVGGVDVAGGMFWVGSQPWLKVNLNGKRFTNEGTGVYDWILHAALNQPSRTYCTVFDSNWKTYAQQFVMHGCCRLYPFENGAPSNMNIQQVSGMIDGLVASGMVIKADTLDDLAKGLNIPVDAFKATVKRYNDLYAAGADPDFGKEGYRLSKLDTPPYYGARQTGSMLCTIDGIRINEDCQAMAEDGTAIKGLYITGNDSGCYYDTSYPNQSTGNACGRTVTFGRNIGKALASSK